MKDKLKNAFAAEIKDGDSIRDVFLVKKKGKGTSRSGNSYLTLVLSDRTGDIEGRVWDRADELDKIFEHGDTILIEGKANQYQGRAQIVVHDISKLSESEVPLSLLLKSSSIPPDKLVGEIKQIFSGLSNSHLKRLTEAFFSDAQFMEDFKRAPAATGIHHSYLGGLAEHILSMSRLARHVASHYGDLDQDMLLAGVLFHDIGKIREMSFKKNFQYTDEGKLLGHIMLGCEMISEKIRTINGFPEELEMKLKHMILSHHGELEYGSPKLPQTLEAVVLHYLDNLDAKVNTISGMLNESGSDWSEFNRFMNRSFYKSSEVKKVPEGEQTQPPQIEAKKKAAKKSSKKAKQKEMDLFE